MKKITLLLAFVFTIFTIGCSCSYNSIEGNGHEVTKVVDVSSFSKIDASHAFDIKVVVGENQKVSISTDENLLEYIEVFVKNNTLYVQTKDNTNFDGDVEVYISVENLTKIDLSGACKIDIKDIDSYDFSVDVSGACKGKLSGKVETLNLDLSGATKLNTVDLISKDVNIDMSGASKLDIYCENNLSIDASGACKIYVYGDPKSTKTDLSGASSINYK